MKPKKHNVDIIGLSGLITPSLDEMVHVAKEMQRQGFTIPMMLGGATTSKAHTAVKVDQNYDHPTVWVKDASRAVGVAQKLISQDLKDGFVAEIRDDYEQVRARHAQRQSQAKWLSLDKARANKFDINWDAYQAKAPKNLGVFTFNDYSLEEISRFLDWTPFFYSWELKGRYPKILDDADKGEEATKLFADAKIMLKQIIDEKWLTANGVVGLFAANSIDDDVEIYADETRTEVLETFHFLRQQQQKPAGKENQCLADFIAPKEAGKKDYMGFFAVTTGVGIDEKVAEFEAQHDMYNAIMLKALADRLAEAFAELMHDKVRKKLWGYASDESLDNDALIAEKYQGIRPAPGYPACPEHTEKGLLWSLLDVEKNTGMTITDHYAMLPTAAVSGYYFSHPDSKYFTVGKINREQVEDYAARKGMSMDEAERWLAPNLGYEP